MSRTPASTIPPGAVSIDEDALARAIEAVTDASRHLLADVPDRERVAEALGLVGESLGFEAVEVWAAEGHPAPGQQPRAYRVTARWRTGHADAPDRVELPIGGLAELPLREGACLELWRGTAPPLVAAMLDRAHHESALVVPVWGERGIWGVVVFARARGRREPYGRGIRACLTNLAAVVGGAVRRQAAVERVEGMRRILEESGRQEDLAALAAGIAHDMNNLLNVLRTGVELVRLEPTSPERHLARMDRSIDAAEALSRELSAFATPSARRVVPVELPRLVRLGLELFDPAFPPDTPFELDLAPDLPPVQGVVLQVGRALGNLVLNAAEAVAEHRGQVWIRARAEERYGRPGVAIRVEDDGPGVPEALQTRLFRPLASTKGARRGLGLATTAALVRAHEGHLRYLPDVAPGACFEVWLPAWDPEREGAG